MNGPSALKVSSDGYDWSGWDMSFEPLSPSIDLIDSSISFQGYVAPSWELDFQVLADLHIRKSTSTTTSKYLNLELIWKSFCSQNWIGLGDIFPNESVWDYRAIFTYVFHLFTPCINTSGPFTDILDSSAAGLGATCYNPQASLAILFLITGTLTYG